MTARKYTEASKGCLFDRELEKNYKITFREYYYTFATKLLAKSLSLFSAFAFYAPNNCDPSKQYFWDRYDKQKGNNTTDFYETSFFSALCVRRGGRPFFTIRRTRKQIKIAFFSAEVLSYRDEARSAESLLLQKNCDFFESY